MWQSKESKIFPFKYSCSFIRNLRVYNLQKYFKVFMDSTMFSTDNLRNVCKKM